VNESSRALCSFPACLLWTFKTTTPGLNVIFLRIILERDNTTQLLFVFYLTRFGLLPLAFFRLFKISPSLHPLCNLVHLPHPLVYRFPDPPTSAYILAIILLFLLPALFLSLIVFQGGQQLVVLRNSDAFHSPSAYRVPPGVKADPFLIRIPNTFSFCISRLLSVVAIPLRLLLQLSARVVFKSIIPWMSSATPNGSSILFATRRSRPLGFEIAVESFPFGSAK